jgi:hypothetical protein
VDLRETEGPRAESSEQLLQTRSTVGDDERAERQDFHRLHKKEARLDSLVGGDGESCDVVLPGRERFD